MINYYFKKKMQQYFKLLLLLFIFSDSVLAQNNKLPVLNIGDKAPPIYVSKWIKGTPIKSFEKGRIYVVEFWATWCHPCIRSMPHLSYLAEKHKENIVVLAIDILEKQSTSVETITAFVDSMEKKMNFNVGVQNSNLMATKWLYNSGEQAIPTTFIVNEKGQIAWIGLPKNLEDVLEKMLHNTWNINDARENRNLIRHLRERDSEINLLLNDYVGDPYKPGDLGKPDSALLLINEIVKKEPLLKYGPGIVSHTFSALLRTDLKKAYDYGKKILDTTGFDIINENDFISKINWYSDKIKFTPEIFELGAEFYQSKYDRNFDIINVPKNYHLMAEMYWKASNKVKAIEAEQNAIISLKSITDFDKIKLEEYEATLEKYKN